MEKKLLSYMHILKREIIIKENIAEMCNLQIYLDKEIGIL